MNCGMESYPTRRHRSAGILFLSAYFLYYVLGQGMPVYATKEQSNENSFLPSSHTSNYAVIVSSSQYWFNYRHAVNALTLYAILKDNGFDDDHIILMLADEYAINDRNVFKNQMHGPNRHHRNKDNLFGSLYRGDLQIDYRGDDVTVENLVAVLTGRPSSPHLPVLNSNNQSHVLVYLTGHGGDEFFKFQDHQEILATELAAIFQQMKDNDKYLELLFVADTCQAFTLGNYMHNIPNVTVIGSSLQGESSYAHFTNDADIGLAVIEKYTYEFSQHVQRKGIADHWSIQDLMIDNYLWELMGAHIGYHDTSSVRKVHQVPVTDFFRNVEREGAGNRRKRFTEDRPTLLPSSQNVPTVSGWISIVQDEDEKEVSDRWTTKPSRPIDNECTSSTTKNPSSTSTPSLPQPRQLTDPLVGSFIAGLGLLVVLASRKW